MLVVVAGSVEVESKVIDLRNQGIRRGTGAKIPAEWIAEALLEAADGDTVYCDSAKVVGDLTALSDTVRADVIMREVEYLGALDFSEVVLSGMVDFRAPIFRKAAKFNRTQFDGWVIFNRTVFVSGGDFSF